MPRSAIILSFPGLSPIVDEWRLDTVEDARNGVPPHITLLFPWKEAPIGEYDVQRLTELCRRYKPFTIVFNKLNYFDSGTVYLSLSNNNAVLKLANTIWEAYPLTPPYEGKYDSPVPHLTVAQCDPALADALHTNIQDSLGPNFFYSCEVNEVVLLQESDQKHWLVRATIKLSD